MYDIFDIVAEECEFLHLKGDVSFDERGENLIEATNMVLD